MNFTLLLLFVFATGILSAQKCDHFNPGQLWIDNIWIDNNGFHMNAYGKSVIIPAKYILKLIR